MNGSPEIPKFLADVRGKLIRVGSSGRLSEEGRRQDIFNGAETISANVRFVVEGISYEHGDVMVKTTETASPVTLFLRPEWIITESE